MLSRTFFAITITGLLLAGLGLGLNAQSSSKASYLGSYIWRNSTPAFGGFSGIHLADQGKTLTLISDRGHFATASVARRDGVISEVTLDTIPPLLDPKGETASRFQSDAEGLAIRDDGRIFVSFEGIHRVWTYRDTTSEAAWLPRHNDFKSMQNNSSLEALAIGPDGVLYTMPERSGKLSRPFPVYRYKGGVWSKAFDLPRRGNFLTVGADFGPDGDFYLLERHFTGIFGFQSRVRRFQLHDDKIVGEEILLTTSTGKHDNLEGLSIWRDGAGDLRLTMVSDDNFKPFQRTELVEYVLRK